MVGKYVNHNSWARKLFYLRNGFIYWNLLSYLFRLLPSHNLPKIIWWQMIIWQQLYLLVNQVLFYLSQQHNQSECRITVLFPWFQLFACLFNFLVTVTWTSLRFTVSTRRVCIIRWSFSGTDWNADRVQGPAVTSTALVVYIECGVSINTSGCKACQPSAIKGYGARVIRNLPTKWLQLQPPWNSHNWSNHK